MTTEDNTCITCEQGNVFAIHSDGDNDILLRLHQHNTRKYIKFMTRNGSYHFNTCYLEYSHGMYSELDDVIKELLKVRRFLRDNKDLEWN